MLWCCFFLFGIRIDGGNYGSLCGACTICVELLLMVGITLPTLILLTLVFVPRACNTLVAVRRAVRRVEMARWGKVARENVLCLCDRFKMTKQKIYDDRPTHNSKEEEVSGA